MKDNVKIFLLGIIAMASVINIFQLASLNKTTEATPEQTSSAVAGNQTNWNNQAQAPQNNGASIPASSETKKTTINWDNMVHDFGNVKQNSENKYSFDFTNTGSEPLVITNAVGSCGCTVPDYPKEPIAPGASAQINVVYKPGTQENQQEKTVTVTANTEPVNTTLKIRAFVEK